MYLFDTPSLERALALPLDPKLRCLLRARVDHINGLDFDVRETSYFLVIEKDATMEDVADELGWSPSDTTFDYVADHDGWLEAITTVSNEAVVTLLIRDAVGMSDELLAACHAHMLGGP